MADEKLLTEREPKKPGRPKGSKDLKPRKKRQDLSKYGNENLHPGDTARYLKHNLKAMALPPIDRDDKEQVQNRILEYFQLCIDDDVKPGVAGLCLALGIDRNTWYTWGAGTRRGGAYVDIVMQSRLVMESILETYTLHGQINPIPALFMFKNHFGYTDKQEMVLTPNNPLGDQASPEELQQKYLDVLTIEDGADTEGETK